ncbi:PilW family protein [Planomicrobium soli]|nr:hypothetical protein [Planomicrobium soli]
MRGDQKGISFVEVLASITLVSIIAMIGWTVLSTGSQHSISETGKTHLQQNANLIMATLSNEHRKSDEYYLRFQNNAIELKSCKDSICGNFRPITESKYKYTGTINEVEFAVWNENQKLEPTKAHVAVLLTVSDSKNPSKLVSVRTKLTRILTSMK